MRPSHVRATAGRRALVALVVLSLAWTPLSRARAQAQPGAQPAPAVRGEAQQHLDRGLALYRARSFQAAAREFELTYRLDPNRDVLYVWAQALRLSGDCAAAIELYQRFLAAEPPRAEADLARVNLARCQAAAAAGPATTRTAPPSTTPAPPMLAPPLSPAPAPAVVVPLAPAPRPVSPGSRRLTQVLLGSGAASVALGGILYMSARSERDAGERAGTYAEVEQHADNARSRERLAWGAASVGATLIVAGVVLYLMR